MDYPAPSNYDLRFERDLAPNELVWRDHYGFLLQRGYQLRPRYKPGWQGSWLTNGKDVFDCEDNIRMSHKPVLDAIRVSDGVKVALKLVYVHTEEVPIGLYFSSPAVRSDPRNHCVSILDVIPMPRNDIWAFIVMPFLRKYDTPPFKQRNECVEAFYHMLEGLEFMHEHNVAHRDACTLNFLMDSTKLMPEGFHHGNIYKYADGVRTIRTLQWNISRKKVGPMKYYWIDFELSLQFHSFKERCPVVGAVGQEKDIPELSWDVPYDPFKLDVCQVGKTINRLCENYKGLEVFKPFIDYLTQDDPQRRPSAAEAFLEFKRLTKTLGRWRLGRRVIYAPSYFNFKSEKPIWLRLKDVWIENKSLSKNPNPAYP